MSVASFRESWLGQNVNCELSGRANAPDDRLRRAIQAPAPSLRAKAKQSIEQQARKLDCCVARAPRNDVKFTHGFAISPPDPREFSHQRPALSNQRARGMPGAQCARSLVCKIKTTHKRSHHGHTPETPGIP